MSRELTDIRQQLVATRQEQGATHRELVATRQEESATRQELVATRQELREVLQLITIIASRLPGLTAFTRNNATAHFIKATKP